MEVAETLQSIVSGVEANVELTQAIATDSESQASAIGEVNAAVRQMEQVTQQNAALVEQTSRAIEQTDEQANTIERSIAVFRTAAARLSHKHAA